MTRVPLTFTEGYNPSSYKQTNNTQLYNFYISNQLGRPVLFPTPGYTQYSAYHFGNNPRGLFYSHLAQGLLIVYDTMVYLWEDDGGSPAQINVGTPLSTQTGKVYFAENFDHQMAISDGFSLFIYDVNTGIFNQASLPEGVTAGMVDYQDSYFILQNKGTRSWYISGSNDGNSWNALDFTLSTSTIVGLAVLDRQVIILGDVIGNVYYDVGSTDFPYQLNNTISMPYGCLSQESIAKGYGLLVWLGISENNSPLILKMSGGIPQPISSENIATLLAQCESPEESYAFLYQMNGHIFYQIHFTEDQLSFLFDLTTQTVVRVTEKDYEISKIYDLSSWKNAYFCLLNEASHLYQLSSSVYTQDGELVPRTWITPTIELKNKKFSVPKLQVYLSQGMQQRSETTSECMLKISHDRGITFPIVRTQNMAPLGQRNALFNFYKLGTDRFWTFQFQFLTEGEVVIMGADIEISVEMDS